MRSILARVAVLAATTVFLLGAPAGAQTPFAPLPQAVPTTPATTVASSSDSGNGGLKHWQEILMFMGGVALIGGIAYVIMKDARRVAPVSADEAAGAHSHSASAARKAHSKQQARKKGKAQRQARKRNR